MFGDRQAAVSVCAAAFLTTAALSSDAHGQETVVECSTFDTDGEGFISRVNPGGGGTITFDPADYSGTGGNPGGYIFHDDEVGGHSFLAPPNFLGDLRGLGTKGYIAYDMRSTDIDISGRRMAVVIENNLQALSVGIPISNTDENIWLHAEFTFEESTGWKYTDASGNVTEPATLAQICGVLATVTEIRLTGETRGGDTETVCIDNVKLVARCDWDLCREDLTGDGIVDGADLAQLLATWGLPCDEPPIDPPPGT